MATGKRYYWIKLKETFMTSDAVDYLMGQPDGANYVVLYQMLCLKTINTDGRLERHIGEIIIPYDEAKIQRDTKWFSIDTIRVAMNLYKALGLIYEDNNGCLALTDHSNLVGSETSWKEQKKLQRAKNLPKLGQCKRLNAQMIRLPSGKVQYVDEKRYGGNGMLAFDLAGGVCEMCGTDQDLLIHHANEYSNDIEDLYVLCKQCHGTAHASGTPSDWLHHTRYDGGQEGGQDGGQEGGLVHPEIDIRDRDKRIEKENRVVDSSREENDSAEPPSVPALTMLLNDGTEYPIYQDYIDQMRELYPAVDVEQELRSMKAWCINNPTKRKTKTGVRKFIGNWLAKEQNRGGKGDKRSGKSSNPFLNIDLEGI